ncbi:MAG: tyrosine-type recombinase/integrase [Candidatus Thiodiazotropha taylori]|nr:tyrosine-type recombinase/integrase [Candidatus Thiodiazotropha taylori]MCW4263602.1 tyrosine-type recombinase/integrase [Candidatus Thiodiazotropha endolucinida]MCG8049334.1 tyrosine-type recombinase/integrase [Candidatus Thiodiazotropha taylori]MCG8112751.1 tyrosine-type recombinase/integrase [Candidatus Thiodiazotropha taylori]MCW4285109.1 tyrosine-type recombinase/integrase [Candidatus Thiodiazotropha taylori]
MLEFLTELFEKGIGYSAINTARCALSAIGLVKDGFAIGAHPVVIRYMKGIFNLRPCGPKYTEIWPVSKVLTYLQKLSPIKELSLKLLTHKLVMLIALTLASRTQSIHLLSIENMSKGYDTYTLQYRGLLKQTKPGTNNPMAELKAYPIDRRLCVIFTLKEYLKRTQSLRQSETCLFISYIKPHKEVSRDTVSRWLRTVMSKSGIDCDKFKTHSIRSAATSKAKVSFVPIDKIMKVAGWSSTKTFGTYYNKPIRDETSVFTDAVLKL